MDLETLLALPRNLKKTFFITHDILIIFVAFWFVQGLKMQYSDEWLSIANWLAFGSTVLLTIILFIRIGLYRVVTRFVSARALTTAAFGSITSAVLFCLTTLVFEQKLHLVLPIVYFLVLMVGVTSSHMILRAILTDHHRKQMVPVIIYGAGQFGRRLLEAIKQANEHSAIAFVNDNPKIQRTVIYDLAVYNPNEIPMLISRYGVRKILLVISSSTPEERKDIIHCLEVYRCGVLTTPGMKDLVDGKISVSSLKKISVVDLLGHAPVAPRPELMSADINDKVVMVTGAGGSTGSELCRQVLNCRPTKLLLFELSEFALYNIDKELRETQAAQGNQVEVVPLLDSVQNEERLSSVMKAYRADTVYHAAIYKYVLMVEFNTIEGIQNNVFDTLCCAQAAVDAGISTFVLISTDEAVRPTNTMGASKRMAELCLQALAAEPEQKTRFCMVCFGGVLGSSGSVVPVLEKQIAEGGPITLTHQDITRHFMTIPEVAQLVIRAGVIGKGGDVFVLDMDESVKIINFARQMTALSGLKVKDEQHPYGDIEIKITGLHLGEKLYEESLIGDRVQETTHSRIMTASEVILPWTRLSNILSELQTVCLQSD